MTQATATIERGAFEVDAQATTSDRFYISGSQTGRDKKFEEDIKATRTRSFISLHSLSGEKKKVDEQTEFTELKDVRNVFKPLKEELGEKYKGSVPLLRVCNFIARQSVYEGVHFPVGDNEEAECGLIVWHQQGGNMLSPAVVEFSFRYRDKEPGPNQEPFSKEMAKLCFDILQVLRDETSAVAKWVDLDGPTKTAFVYGLTRA